MIFSWLSKAFTAVFALFCIAAAFVILLAAEHAAVAAYKRIRFHCGRIRAEVAPLNQDEARALLTIRRGYRKWTPEPIYRAREDS